jgi:hypothetical protein
MIEALSIRAVVFQDKGWWVAQCLEEALGALQALKPAERRSGTFRQCSRNSAA